MTSRKTSDVIEQLRAGTRPPKAAMRVPFAPVVMAEEGNSNDSKSIKVNLKARQRGPINHWYWGTVWHDLSSYRTKGPKIAIDDSHWNEIGYGRPHLTEYGLEVDGVVIPNGDCPEHESNRIAYNLRNGIPQEASIDFSGDYDLLEVPEGMSVPCNGQTAAGPCLVIRNWPLRAVAICKEGADESTRTEMATALSAGESPAPLPKSITTFSAAPMPQNAGVAAPVSGASPAPNPTALDTSASTPAVKEPNTMSQASTQTPAAPAAPTSAPAPTNLSAPAAATPPVIVAPATPAPSATAPASPAPATQAAPSAPATPAAPTTLSATQADGKPVEGAPAQAAAAPEGTPVEATPAATSTPASAPTQQTTPATPSQPAPVAAPTVEQLNGLQAEIDRLTQEAKDKDAKITKLEEQVRAMGTGGAAPVPAALHGANTPTSPLTWKEALEATRKAMKREAIDAEVLAEAVRRYPDSAKRVRTQKQAK